MDLLETTLSSVFIINLLASTVRMAAPILIGALGEIFTEKSGILNIGLEAQMLAGALCGFIGAYYTGSNLMGLLIGALGGVSVSLLFAVMTVSLHTNQIVVGITTNILIIGLTTFFYRVAFGTQFIPPTITPMPEIHIPILSTIPVLGPVLFQQKALVYVVFFMVPVAHFLLYRTTIGLNIRAVGELPIGAETMGINVRLVRYLCILAGGACTGLGGAFLSIGQLARFADNMVAGRGFIALAIVIFGQWKPYRAALAALVFGFADSLQFSLQAVGFKIPEEFLRMTPYLVTVVAMTLVARKAFAPAALATSYEKET